MTEAYDLTVFLWARLLLFLCMLLEGVDAIVLFLTDDGRR